MLGQLGLLSQLSRTRPTGRPAKNRITTPCVPLSRLSRTATRKSNRPVGTCYYRTAGPAFIERLAYLEPHLERPAAAHTLRVEDVDAIKTIRDAWLGDLTNAPETLRGVLHVRDFIPRAQHERLVRLERADDDTLRVRDMAGYMDKVHGLALLTDEGIRQACNGAPAPEVAHELKWQRQRLLHVNEGTRLKSRHSVPGAGRQRFYAVRLTILEYELPAGADDHHGAELKRKMPALADHQDKSRNDPFSADTITELLLLPFPAGLVDGSPPRLLNTAHRHHAGLPSTTTLTNPSSAWHGTKST